AYYQIKNGRGYFKLGAKRARRAGWFRPDGRPLAVVSLGPDGPDAWKRAAELHADYLRDCKGKPHELVTAHPKVSVGAWYDFYRTSAAFTRKKIRSREDYERAWVHLGRKMGHLRIAHVSVAEFEEFQLWCQDRLTPNDCFRTVAKAKAIFAAA